MGDAPKPIEKVVDAGKKAGGDVVKTTKKAANKVSKTVSTAAKQGEKVVSNAGKGVQKQVRDVRDNTLNVVSESLGKDAAKVAGTALDVFVEQPLARTGKNIEKIPSDPFGAAVGLGLETTVLPTSMDAATRAKNLLKPPSLGNDLGDVGGSGGKTDKTDPEAPTNDNAEDAVDEDTGITDQTGDVSTSEEYMGQRSRNRKAKGRASTILAGGGAGELGQDSASAKRTLLGYV